MLTSSLADKLVIVKSEIILNFMIDFINPPCNSLLSTFFELNWDKCQRRAS